MPIVALGVLMTHGKTYLRGEEIPGNVLAKIPAYVHKIWFEQASIRSVSDEEMLAMCYEREASEESAKRERRLKQIVKAESDIAELKEKLSRGQAEQVAAQKAIGKLEDQLAVLLKEDPTINPEPPKPEPLPEEVTPDEGKPTPEGEPGAKAEEGSTEKPKGKKKHW